MSQNQANLPYPVIDGFSLITKRRCDLQFNSFAEEQYNALRRLRAYRSRSWCIPEDPGSQSIPARDSFEFQVWMKPGSAIWGYTFTGDCFAGGTVEEPLGIDSFQFRETCTDVPQFSEFATKQPNTANFFGKSWAKQQYLSSLLVVPPPGLVHVEIATTSASARQIQLILWGGEPA